jgi:hypothetical protein
MTVKKLMIVGLLTVLCGIAGPLVAAEYYVALTGNDRNPGTMEKPLRTIQQGVDRLMPGDICFVREGTYRETVRLRRSGTAAQPIRVQAMPGEVVVISGTEVLSGKWTKHRQSIYKTNAPNTFEQLFVDNKMMIEARWPNAQFDQILERDRWAATDVGSRYGKIIDAELAKTGIDWTGALATLNVAHQFFSWTRIVSKHAANSEQFTYDKNLPGITHFADKTEPWEDDRYYLSGKLEALDVPTEWYLNTETRELYLWSPDGKSPAANQVEYKVRDYAFFAEGLEFIEIAGFHLFVATVNLLDCNSSVVEGCHMQFATYAREISEKNVPGKPTVMTLVTGRNNTIRNCSLAYSNNQGLRVLGSNNRIENNIVHDICWSGNLSYTAIYAGSDGEDNAEGGSLIRRNTVFRTGNAGIQFNGMPNVVAEYNHVYSGGHACKDVALLYTQRPDIAGSIIRYNWVHGCDAPHIALGIRGDDQTRGLTIHNNVVWDIGWEGIIVKGDDNNVFNNTCFGNWSGSTENRQIGDIQLPMDPEPLKPWKKQWALIKVQNLHSLAFNNLAQRLYSDRKSGQPPVGPAAGNYVGSAELLEDVSGYDFRPKANSPLIDAGEPVPGFMQEFRGDAPDIGAYEYGGDAWTAGHTTRLWTSRTQFSFEKKQTSATLRVALSMPPLETVQVRLIPTDDRVTVSSGENLTFTPENWMQPQDVTLTLRKSQGGTGFLGIRIDSGELELLTIPVGIQ